MEQAEAPIQETFKILFSKEQIQKRVEEMAIQIKNDCKDLPYEITLVIVLNGAMYLGIDLSRALGRLGLKHKIETVRLKSYDENNHGNKVEIIQQPQQSFSNRNVIVVEDVVDRGLSMNVYHEHLMKTNPPLTVKYLALLKKKIHGELKFPLEYVGYEIDDVWVKGYGMDSDGGYGRELEDIMQKI